MSIQYKAKLIVISLILALYIAWFEVDQSGIVSSLSPGAVLAAELALAFAGGIVVGITAAYLWTLRTIRHDGAARSACNGA